MLFTISGYQKQKGVSLQYISEYTQKGVFKKIDLPVFVEYQGEKIQVGKKRMLQVPPQYLPDDAEEIREATALASQITDDAEIREAFKKMLLQSADEERLRKRYDRIFHKKHPKYETYKKALNTFLDIIQQQAEDLLVQADSLLHTVKNRVN
jgi:hypothetical protein